MSHAAIERILSSIAGLTAIKKRRIFSKWEDVHVWFTFVGHECVVEQPWGDSSTYWIVPKDPNDRIDIGAVEDNQEGSVGLEVVVEDGEAQELDGLGDPTDILHRVLPSAADRTFCCLNCVDWYGDTTFNQLQIPLVREELARLMKGDLPQEAIALLTRIDELAALCLTRPGLYLKFYGD